MFWFFLFIDELLNSVLMASYIEPRRPQTRQDKHFPYQARYDAV
jgi:hypothetical protein